MGEPGLISAYLTEIRYSLGKLGSVDEILAEVEDHPTESSGHRSTAPSASRSATKRRLQPARNESTHGWSYVVAGGVI